MVEVMCKDFIQLLQLSLLLLASFVPGTKEICTRTCQLIKLHCGRLRDTGEIAGMANEIKSEVIS